MWTCEDRDDHETGDLERFSDGDRGGEIPKGKSRISKFLVNRKIQRVKLKRRGSQKGDMASSGHVCVRTVIAKGESQATYSGKNGLLTRKGKKGGHSSKIKLGGLLNRGTGKREGKSVREKDGKGPSEKGIVNKPELRLWCKHGEILGKGGGKGGPNWGGGGHIVEEGVKESLSE